MIISVYQAKELLNAHNSGLEEKAIALELGQKKEIIKINKGSFIFPDGQTLDLASINKVIKKEAVCFLIQENTVFPVSLFSEDTNKFYKLVPTGKDTFPTLEISGIRMHVTKNISPKEDTEKKVSFVSPCVGKVLDTCTGLGYTAILAAKTAEKVYTFEKDSNVIEIEKYNPYSKELFTKNNIKRTNGDIFIEIKKLQDSFFDRIIHDPPRLALATLLYSQEFYDELFRVLKKGGKIYHYTGDPGSKRGLDIRAGIIKRLEKSGFIKIERVFNGIKAEKSN